MKRKYNEGESFICPICGYEWPFTESYYQFDDELICHECGFEYLEAHECAGRIL